MAWSQAWIAASPLSLAQSCSASANAALDDPISKYERTAKYALNMASPSTHALPDGVSRVPATKSRPITVVNDRIKTQGRDSRQRGNRHTTLALSAECGRALSA